MGMCLAREKGPTHSGNSLYRRYSDQRVMKYLEFGLETILIDHKLLTKTHDILYIYVRSYFHFP